MMRPSEVEYGSADSESAGAIGPSPTVRRMHSISFPADIGISSRLVALLFSNGGDDLRWLCS
jgi:hypothetical protein